MIKVNFGEEIVQILDYERYHYPHPQIQKRMEAIYLKSRGLSHSEICRLCQITEKTLSTWLKMYRDSGLEGLKVLNYKGRPSELNSHISSLEEYFKEHPPRTSSEAQSKIAELTGIQRGPTQTKEFLKRMGLSLRKVGHVPGKALEPDKIQEQDRFQKEELKPRLQEAKLGKRTLFL
jgi:transposase